MTELSGSTVVITGGTGSFGSTMVQDLLRRDVGAIHVLSRDEAKQDQMRRRFDDPRLRYFLGDVRDYVSVKRAMRGADFVFHAAALKQVPSCEFFPDEAIKTNVQGSHNVIEAAADAGARSVVCLSTDKAVYPVSAMGMSKALMEKTVQAFARNNPGSHTAVAVTRYGNVMYSRGSVIPRFVRQLREGGPLTVTEPEMTRFLMSLDESVNLVHHAFLHAAPGDVFVRKAPAATVETIARAVATIMGIDDPTLQVIGPRHGEKFHETLLTREELATAKDQGPYFRVPLDGRSMNYGHDLTPVMRPPALVDDYTSENAERLTLAQTVELLLTLPQMRALCAVRPASEAQPVMARALA